MAKLHELLAVESNLSDQANKTREDLTATFHGKRHLFEEKKVTFIANEENSQRVTEEQQDIQSTVAKEFEWFTGIMAKAIDADHNIDEANTQARADVELEDGTVIVKGIPATSLLQLERRITEMRGLVDAAPTLDPAKGFQPDPQRGHGFYQARLQARDRTKKIPTTLVKYPATDKHPAQTEVFMEDKPVGKIETQEWSAMLTPATKTELLDRCDILLRAVKKARAKANDIEISTSGLKIGKQLLGYVIAPLRADARKESSRA